MSMEIRVLRLPVGLSDLVDEAVFWFVQSHANERVQAYQRYHDADLWMVYVHEPSGETEPAFLTRRVTIGLYSDDPDHLRFIPDIVVTKPSGRYTLEHDPQADGLRDHVAPVSVLQARLAGHPEEVSRELLDEHFLGSIAAALKDAWYRAKRLTPPQATQRIT